MLVPEMIVRELFAAADKCDGQRTAIANAVRPMLAKLRLDLACGQPNGPPPMMRACMVPPVLAGEAMGATVARLRIRMDEIELARRFGDEIDVRRMLNLTIDELNEAAAVSGKRLEETKVDHALR